MNADDASKVTDMLINPFHAVVFAPHLFTSNPRIAKEDWMLLNASLIEEMGSKAWLKEFLNAISLSQEIYDGHDITNPGLVIRIASDFQGSHSLAITRKDWVLVNTKLIDELGISQWLDKLLVVLETGKS